MSKIKHIKLPLHAKSNKNIWHSINKKLNDEERKHFNYLRFVLSINANDLNPHVSSIGRQYLEKIIREISEVPYMVNDL